MCLKIQMKVFTDPCWSIVAHSEPALYLFFPTISLILSRTALLGSKFWYRAHKQQTKEIVQEKTSAALLKIQRRSQTTTKMKTIISVLALFAVLNLATAQLECYSCLDEKCTEPAGNWQKVANCGGTLNPADKKHVGACLKLGYTDLNKNAKTIRKCIIAEKDASGKLQYPCNSPIQGGTVTTCDVCDSNLCNSAPVTRFGYVTVLGAAMACLLHLLR
ncbi:uncharacterized protein LOC115885088 [Sitophilus oryzae]|uniref:Uncharacterized protein LOC115885088 n=1 Tax=Sitophilus oryzae TaxID=7048 RepID=A0A6J2Y918_SITOR|nr:uncharacterized protein LOC115885088 [Sitophilus oryzae]